MLARGIRIEPVISVTQQSTVSTTTTTTTSRGTPTSSHSVTASNFTSTPVQTSTHTPSINTSPFFPEPSTLNPPPDPGQWSRDVAKTVLAFLTIILAAVVFISLASKRFLYLRRTNRPLSQFFTWRRHQASGASNSSNTSASRIQTQTQIPSPSNIRTRFRSHPADYAAYALPFSPSPSRRHITALVDDDVRYPITAASLSLPHATFPTYTYPYPHTHSYPPNMSAQRHHNRNNRTRIRAVDTDAQGRRLDSGWDPDRFDFEIAGGQGVEQEDKDMLPAYDCYGGPPKYADVEMEVDEMETVRGADAEQGSRNSERPASSSAVAGHHDVAVPLQENND